MTTDLDLLIRLTKENDRLQKQVTELQARSTEQALELRSVDRKRMVREFFTIAGQEIPERFCVPSDKVVRFRNRLIVEEFCELLKASYDVNWHPEERPDLATLDEVIGMLKWYIEEATLQINIPEAVDATIDLDFVVEGWRIAFGINSTPLWSEVHKKNLEKQDGPKRESDGKQLKPPSWQPPRIEKLLREQGFK